MKLKLLLGTTLLFLITSFAKAQNYADSLFDYTVLHEIRFEFESDDYWETLVENYTTQADWKNTERPKLKSQKELFDFLVSLEKTDQRNDIDYLECNVTIDGETLESVGARLKGYSSYFASNQYKKSLKIDFNAFNDTLKYNGLRKLNLNNGVGDPSMQRDFISYYMMRKAGIAAPRVSYAKVYLNGIYWGIYNLVEQVDRSFLERNFASSKGNLFKNIGWSELEYTSDNFDAYFESIELKTNEETADGSDYVNFVKSMAQLNGNNFNDSIQKLFYVDYYLKVLAIDIISKNWDSYIEHGRNFYLYHEPVSDLFYWIPWDYNLAWDGGLGEAAWMDEECDTQYSFSYDTTANIVNFTIQAKAEDILYVYISFGNDEYEWYDNFDVVDGLIKLEDEYTYEQNGIYSIEVWIEYDNGCYLSEFESIVLLDTTTLECPTAMRMNRAYFPNDENFIKAFNADSFCCDCQWDNICENLYFKDLNSSIDDDYYAIEYETMKVLIRKLLDNSDFENRYKDAFRFILDSVFNENELETLIASNTNLIREAVYTDTNYNFTTNEFENDIVAFCDNNYQITSLNRLISKRRQGLEIEYNALNYNAQPIEKTISYNDIVLNEFMANTGNDDETSDWIELYNNTNDIIPLTNVWISDSIADAQKFNFGGNSAIKPDGFILVHADKKDKKNNFHANFKLNAEGEEILLTHSIFDTLDVIKYNEQVEEYSTARFPNGTGAFTTMQPTPNKHNRIVIPDKVLSTSVTTFEIYPNPVSSFVNIIPANKNFGYNFSIFDAMGNILQTQIDQQGSILLNLENLKKGMYIVQIVQQGKTYHTPLIVQY